MIIGIDMGGTNIDGVAIKDTKVVKSVKSQVDRKDFFASIWHCLTELLTGLDKEKIRRIHLSTTISTNAIVEGKVSEVGLILQTGPGLNWQYDRMGNFVEYISGSVDHRGKIVQGTDQEELDEIKSRFKQGGVEVLAVVSKFSTRNPEVEQQIREHFADNYSDITLGHSLSGKLNFPRRVRTAYLNAAVGKTFRQFAINMKKALERENITAPVYILKADGGTIDLEGAIAKPVETILSGPAASFMGMMALAADDTQDRCLLDIGGTTTDLFFLIDGSPVFEPGGIEIDERKTLVRAIFSTSIGLGGDSYVRFEDGSLKIGPQRLDNAVAYGGKYLTPTDALLYLGALGGDYPERSKEALEDMARQNNVEPGQLAQEIVDLMCQTIADTCDKVLKKLNASPVYTIRELLQDRVIKPQAATVIGGPSEALAKYLERTLSMPVSYTQYYEIANAIGAALAKPTIEINLLADTERGILTIPELEIYDQVGKNYTLSQARRLALTEVKRAGQALGLSEEQLEAEIVEANSFNMVSGWFRVDKNIRVRAQIKPGLLATLQPELAQRTEG